MKILALEFSSARRSVAVVSGDSQSPPAMVEVVESSSTEGVKPLRLAEEALRKAGLEREQIECIAVGLGPGSYTGVRMAIAMTQGWGLGLNVKLLGLSSVEVIAGRAVADGLRGSVSVVVDAQRNEFYLAGFRIEVQALREMAPLRLASLQEVSERQKAGDRLLGPEVTRWFPEGTTIFPGAATLGRMALSRTNFVEGARLGPIYLRETNFTKAPPARSVA